MILYLLLADIQNTALAALLIFSERVLYPTYAAVPRLWGISALDDQAAAGAIMWVPRLGDLSCPCECTRHPMARLSANSLRKGVQGE